MTLMTVIRLAVKAVLGDFDTFQGKHVMATFPYAVCNGVSL